MFSSLTGPLEIAKGCVRRANLSEIHEDTELVFNGVLRSPEKRKEVLDKRFVAGRINV